MKKSTTEFTAQSKEDKLVKTNLGKEKVSNFFQEQQSGVEASAKPFHLQFRLEGLKNETKNKLNKERGRILDEFLEVQAEITRWGETTTRKTKLVSLENKLLKVPKEHENQGFEWELALNILRQTQREFIELELKNSPQTKIEIPPKK